MWAPGPVWAWRTELTAGPESSSGGWSTESTPARSNLRPPYLAEQ
jgi:hypothetical protein